jgi:hypothetical protein
MNIYEIETLLIGMVISGSMMALFIYLGNRALSFHKNSPSPEFKRSAPSFEGKALKSAARRRRIESNPSIICSLPIHQAVRPEAPLL